MSDPIGSAGLSPAKRALLELRLGRHANDASPKIPRRSDRGPAPLSFAQERLWLLDQLIPDRSVYNVPRAIRVPVALDVEALRTALETIVRRHEILRTRIEVADGMPLQVISEESAVELTFEDLRHLPERERATAALTLVDEVAQRPFALDHDLLLRAGLVRVGDADDLLLLVTHHIASDETSKSVLFTELAQAYDAIAAGLEPSLPDLPIQYADFAVWQRERLRGSRIEKLLSYWRARLIGAPQLLELPTDHPRPAVQTYRGGRHRFVLSDEASDGLRALAREEGVTLFMAALAAFSALLHRYSGSTDLVVGAPISGRHHHETAGLIGFFANTLPLRVDVDGDPSFSKLLGRVREVAVEAYAHQELPFERLVEELNPERNLSHAPIFQVSLLLDPGALSSPSMAGSPVSLVFLERAGAKFDLSLALFEHFDGTLGGFLEYSSDLFEPDTIERMTGHFENLILGAVNDPEKALSQLPLLTPGEYDLLVYGWNSTEAPYPKESLDELISDQARRTPDGVAVVDRRRSVSYGELEERSNRLAHELRARGVGPDVLVGICLERSVDLLVGLLGVLKAGGAYVPIDPTYPAERQKFMLSDSRALILITQESLLAGLPRDAPPTLCLDLDWGAIAARPAERPSPLGPGRLAYVIYTSGSTGRPKGVEIEHGALVNFLWSMRQRPGLGADDVLVAVTTLSFDIAGLELYLPLLVGAKLVIATGDEAADPTRLSELLERFDATVLQATPTTWRLLVESGWSGRPRLKALCGGEPLSLVLADKLADCGLELWNMYGPTETTIWSTIFRVRTAGEPLAIGHPIGNTTLYILDDKLEPTPIGVPGELFIGGAGLARGYRNRPDLTAERFVDHPFAAGERLYRTGDLARYRPDATVEFIGRLDDQVKVRGFRIELGEIENVLSQHSSVASAVALVRPDASGDSRLIAYVVPANGPVPAGELRRYLGDHLPPYMVPQSIVSLEELPLTPNGKVDRGALPALDPERQAERAVVAARTPLEEALVEIWEDVLELRPVSVTDDFFEVGGHSLLAFRMISRVRSAFDADVYLRTVFEHPTIEQLAEVLARQFLANETRSELEALLNEVEAAVDG